MVFLSLSVDQPVGKETEPRAAMATPQIPGGKCGHCQAPIIDLFAEWTEEYQTREGKQNICEGRIVFDCYYCEGPLQRSTSACHHPP